MIKMINICKKFVEIFPGIEDPTYESALFYFMSNIDKVYSNDNIIAEKIFNEINVIDSYNINAEIKENLKFMINIIEKPMFKKISEFIFNLGDGFKSIGCVPHQFIKFSEKATIFTSSDYDQVSLTLPGRKIEIASFIKPTIRIFGSIFSSILIESFLNIKEKNTIQNHFVI